MTTLISKQRLSSLAAVIAILFLSAASAMAQEGRSQINLQGTGVIFSDTDGDGLRHEATRSADFLWVIRINSIVGPA